MSYVLISGEYPLMKTWWEELKRENLVLTTFFSYLKNPLEKSKDQIEKFFELCKFMCKCRMGNVCLKTCLPWVNWQACCKSVA